jgi:hypothetical protein
LEIINITKLSYGSNVVFCDFDLYHLLPVLYHPSFRRNIGYDEQGACKAVAILDQAYPLNKQCLIIEKA